MFGILDAYAALRNKGCHPSQARAGWQQQAQGSHAITIALRLRTKLLKQVK